MDTIFTLCNDRQNRRNGINTTTKNYVACNEANASIVNCSTGCAVAPVVSRRATTTTTLSTFSSAKPTFSSAKLIGKKLSIVNCTLLIVFCLLFGTKAFAQTTVNCYPPNETYATGYTSSSSKTSGEMQTVSGGGVQGWMKFDVSSIPNSANISAITLHFYCTSTSNSYVKLTSAGLLNPASASASELYSAIRTETPNYYTSTYISGFSSTGWKNFALSTDAINNLQSSGLSSDYFTIGFYEYESGSYNLHADGYNGTNKPYIEVTYTVPIPTPTISQSSTPLCGENVTLTASLGGESMPSGYSYHWFDDAACTHEIGTGESITIESSNGMQVWCRLQKPQEQQVTTFGYTGGVQSYSVPNGTTSLNLEVWGAQGGYRSSSDYGGKGGYSHGTLTNLSGVSTLYVVVGGSGRTGGTSGGYNGGGSRSSYYGGGGATHIANVSGLLSARSSDYASTLYLVAGGGGSDGATNKKGMYGGGESGGTTSESYGSGGQGGTQSGGGAGSTSNTGTKGSFGKGGAGYYANDGYAGAGGGGFYGGGGSYPDSSSDDDRGGGGGSGYVNTSLLTSTNTVAGNTSFSAPAGATETGHTGDGYARITATVTPCGSAGSHTIECNTCPVIAKPTNPTSGEGCGTATISASVPDGFTIDWYNAASGGSIVTNGTGTSSLSVSAIGTNSYYAEARNISSGCVSDQRTEVTATVYPAFSAGTLSGSTERCAGASSAVVIDAPTPTGAPGFTYKWYKDGELIAGATSEDYTFPAASVAELSANDVVEFTREVRNTCASGEVYVASGSFTLTIVEQPTASITNGIQHVCRNTSANALGVNVSNAGDMSYDYRWYQAGNVTPVATTSTYTPPTGTAGNNSYYCTVLFDDDYGCADASTGYAQIEVYELPTTVLSSDYSKTCRGSEITLSAATTPGSGTESFSYDWASVQTGGGAPQSTSSIDECTMVPYNGGTYTYRVTVTDNYHCSATSTVAVKVYDDVVISGVPASAIDPGTLITLTATPQLGASVGNTSDCSYHWISSVLNGIMSYDDNPASDRPTITTYYSVVATVTESGCTIQSSPQEVEVNASSGGINETCGNSVVIYCTNNGSGTTGSSTDPMSLTTALTKASQVSTRTVQDPVIIRMATGDYTFATTINLQSNVIIDGGWNANTTSGVWTKGNGTTKIKGTFAEVTSNNTKHRIALKSENKTGWRLQDLTIDVTGYTYDGGTDFNGTSYKGNSVYGIYMTGTSTYDSLIRVNLKVGDGGKGGTKNVTFTYTAAQLKGGNGSKSSATSGSSCNNGVSGGSAASGPTGTRKGGNGGNSGGGGGWSSSGSSGSSGSAGGGGASGGSSGSAGVTRSCGFLCIEHLAGGDGGAGNPGAEGSGYTTSTLPASMSFGTYFNPGELGRTGNDGQGGSGGGGGGGGSGEAATNGNPGGSGGAGGAGGQGGGGAAGGGASFGIYCYGSALPVFESTKITVGNAGKGGTGQTGQTGGNGGTRGERDCECSGRCGGNGGAGGAGGKGKDGENGVAGVAYKIAVVSGTTLTSYSTSGYATTPSNYISSIDYGSYSKKGCTNSQIAVTKTSGSFASYTINDETPSSASYSGNNAIMAFTSTGRYLATTANSQYNPYIFITQERTLGSITGSPTEFCQGASPAFQYSGSLDNGEVCLWYLVNYDDGSEIDTYMEQYNGSPLAGYTIPESVPAGRYYIKLILKSNCCGISVPIWQEITIYERPEILVDATNAICYGGNGSIEVTASDGTPDYSFSSDGGSSWTSASNPYTFELPYGDYNIMVKDANECVSDETPVSIGQPETFTAGEIENDGQILCYNTGTIDEIGNATSASGGEGTIYYQWYVGGSEISGATSATYTPANTYKTNPGTYEFTRKAKYGSCPDWTESDGSWMLTVYPQFKAGTIASTGDVICKDATPATITVTTAASGGDGNIHYQWYVGLTAIDGAIEATYTPTAYAGTAGTYTFTRKVSDETCNTTPTASDGSWTLTVESASVGTVSASATPSTICVGKSAELSISTTGNSGDMSYNWRVASTTVTPNVTTTYQVTATATTAGATCTDETIKEVTVTVAAPSVDGITSGDLVWSGNAGTTSWGTAGNWLTYNGSTYSVAASAPSESISAYLVTYGDGCSVGNPALGGSSAVKNLTIGAGKELSLGTNTLSIAGNLTNEGALNYNTGKVVFKGTDQTITNATSMEFYDVQFAQSSVGTITAANGITVNNVATFDKGIVMGNMTFNAGATASNVTDSASFVAGKVTKKVGSSSDESNFVFPTGSALDGQPKVLGSVQVTTLKKNSETWVAFRQKSNGGGFDDLPRWWNQNNNCEENATRFDHVSNFEYWNVNTTSELTAKLTVSSANQNAHFNESSTTFDGNDIFGAMWMGGCWRNVGGSTVVSGDHKTITMTGITIPGVSTRDPEPSWLTMGSKDHETVLPIELLSFSATCNGKYAELEWSTATERNNDYFVIERSDDAINFTEVGRVAGAGNSIEQLDYTYNDYGIHGGDNYYRLVQVDYDGTRSVSDIVVATCIDTEVVEPDVHAFPNPFNGELTVVLDNFDNRPATIEVYDMLGKLIYMQKAASPQNSYETILNLSNLPTGAYNVRVSTADFVINRQVVKN